MAWGSGSGQVGSLEPCPPSRKCACPPSAVLTQVCSVRRGAGIRGCGTLHGPEHKLRSEMDLKPENSLLQRYKSVTAEMYSNKLGGGRGDGAGTGHTP